MEPIYVGQNVPTELLIGQPIGTMQLFVNHNSDKVLYGVSNEGKCIKPAILTRAILLNTNFFAWENEQGSKSIANKYGKDLAEISSYIYYIAPEHIVSHKKNDSMNQTVTTQIGTKVDGTNMSEDELIAYEKNVGYQMRINLVNGLYEFAEDTQIVDSNNLPNKDKSTGMSM